MSIIDVHSHHIPPFYRHALSEHGHSNPDGMPAIPPWSVEDHLKLMDEIGIAKSILSISSPGTHLVQGDEVLAERVTRSCNTYTSELKQKYPDKFGYFASLPLPNVELSIQEIGKATEEGCDGFVVLTNAHGHYIGDAVFDPVLDELNRRKAVVLVHPTTPCKACDSGAVKTLPLEGKWPNPLLEFFFDTARVVANLFMYGAAKRYPDIKWIIPHVGGALPPVLSRFSAYSSMIPGPWEALSEDKVEESLLNQFYFDLAGFPFPSQIKGLLSTGVSAKRLMYGSDYCYTPAAGAKMLAQRMDVGLKELFDQQEIGRVYRGNAEELLKLSMR